LLRAVDVSFSYGQAGHSTTLPVLRGVSAEVRRGEVLGILGPNGSGKTTLLRLLSGTRRPSAGEVLLDDTPLLRLSRREIARQIAVVPQETQLAFDYSVMEMVLMGRHPHLGVFELEGPNDFAIARDALRATGTDALEGRQFNTLSGGEKQRVVIASALAQATDLLLLDEPSSSLDLRYQLETADLLRRLNRERGATLVLSTHDLNFAASICDSLLLIREGRVLMCGAPRQVLTPDSIRELYGVEADVQEHSRANRLTVVPIRASDDRGAGERGTSP
jgi:iron complex transport system ATP-binding protein